MGAALTPDPPSDLLGRPLISLDHEAHLSSPGSLDHVTELDQGGLDLVILLRGLPLLDHVDLTSSVGRAPPHEPRRIVSLGGPTPAWQPPSAQTAGRGPPRVVAWCDLAGLDQLDSLVAICLDAPDGAVASSHVLVVGSSSRWLGSYGLWCGGFGALGHLVVGAAPRSVVWSVVWAHVGFEGGGPIELSWAAP